MKTSEEIQNMTGLSERAVSALLAFRGDVCQSEFDPHGMLGFWDLANLSPEALAHAPAVKEANAAIRIRLSSEITEEGYVVEIGTVSVYGPKGTAILGTWENA